MVLMRRRDKRRGNEAEEIIVASDSSIVANKGLRSLGGARSGRFAADMRVSIGGYGRADKTWGVDHPWHSTEEGDLFSECTHEEPVRGLSRAQLKKRKAKLKKQGLTAKQAADEALKEAEEAKKRHEEEQRLKEQREAGGGGAKKEKRKKEKQKKKEKKQEAMEQAQQQTKEQEQEVKSREVLASAYEENVGNEVTTKSGLVIQDQRIGQDADGQVPWTSRTRWPRVGKGMLATTFGTGSVIAGWEEGLGTMRPGGVRLLTIPPELGYGESGKGDKIPPNSTLFFEVELVRIGKRKREAIGNDDIPLPSSFQRKRIKQKPGKKSGEDEDDGEEKLSKSQLKRRRRNRNKNQSQEDDA
ncbi:Peptidyl-prolyl cis-trans isomerase, FKBP-type [Phytophthora cactorum]|nr:Peptidyl-prolyl cis-trans isomerase, FKBP-type [Phytophthora cactorum]